MDLRIEGLVRDFDGFAALSGVDLSVQSGELAALLGPSGSGKTTLLRLIAGLIAPTSGRIFFGEQDASRLSVQERHVGFVFQHYALFRHMSVLDNIAFGLRVAPRSRRPDESEIRRRAGELLDLVQLPGLAERYPSQLSGGQRQRVALARALAIQPRLLLLDEPFGALDAKVRRELRRWLREIHDKTGHTTLFVTHDQEEALELADRVVVMEKGRIVQEGPPEAIYDAPNSPFVFGFIGESSSLPVELIGGEVRFEGAAIGIAASGVGPASLHFRPQDAMVAKSSEQETGAAQFRGRVAATRRHQGAARVEIELGEAASRVEIEVPADSMPERGQTIVFGLRRWRLFALERP
jgi:sulfate transport system ATP-binding protein